MIDTFFIFGAKYLFILTLMIAAISFYRASAETRKQMIIFGLIAFPLALLLSVLAREMYSNPRPFVVGNFEPLIHHEADNGFPSDHALLVATVAAYFLFFNRRIALWLALIAIVVGLSRIYVGVHHPIDILGSMAIALISTGITYATISAWNKNK